MKKIMMVIIVLLVAAGIYYYAADTQKKNEVIRVGHKDFTEMRLAGQLIAVYLENKGFEVKVIELSGTMLIYTALKTGEIDIYPEYTGTAYGAILKQTKILDPQATYDYVKKTCVEKDGITWAEPFGFNNTYVLSVRSDTQKKYDLKTVSDLVKVAPEFKLGCDKEFQNRTDGLKGLQEAYGGLDFKSVIPMDQGLTYAALNNEDIDVNVSYSTDGRIMKFKLKNLQDDKNFFPPYYLTPIMQLKFAETHPEVVEALEELGSHWDDASMQKYNLMVDEGKDPQEVAMLMLENAGIIQRK